MIKKMIRSQEKLIAKYLLVLPLLILATFGKAQLLTQTPKVPEQHPRVLLMPDDVIALKIKRNTPRFKALWNKIEGANNAVCMALVYLLDNNQQKGKMAIKKAFDELQSGKGNRGIKFFNQMFRGALVYDWCYPLLTSEQKSSFIREFREISQSHSPYWPVNDSHDAITSHNVEGWFFNQLIAGLAIYNEEPVIFEKASDTFFKNFQDVRNFFFKSHMHHQGWYFGTRYVHVMVASWVYKRLTGKDIFVADQQYVPYHLLYSIRPDGQILRIGDVTEDAGKHEFKDVILAQTANYFQDPYLRYAADAGFFDPFNKLFVEILDFLTYNQETEPKPLKDLPLTKYFPEPMGSEMIARTGWQIGKFSNDAIVQMRIGQYYFGNHQHKDFGTFQIFYKGNLTGNSGMYKGTKSDASTDYWKNYYRSTISSNGLLIRDPSERYSGSNWTNTIVDGGQRWPLNNDVQPNTLKDLLNPKNGYKYADVIAHEFGPDTLAPEFSYISGDLTPGYVYNNSNNKVKKVTRSMVTFNTTDAKYPCVFVVFDRIAATDANFEKTFLLHSIQKPEIKENKTIIERGDGYNGKLVSYTLLPEKPTYSVTQGPEINGIRFDPGTKRNRDYEDLQWRLGVSPSEKNLTDEFLHVMAVMDYNTPDPGAEKLLSDNLVGAKVLDKIVMFSKDGNLISDASLDIQGNNPFDILICDVEPGKWMVKINGEIINNNLTVNHDGQTLYFEAMPGKIEIQRKESEFVVR